MRISDWSSDVCSSDLTVRMRVSAPIASALTERLRATKLSSACSIWLSVALAVSYIALASPLTSSGPRCLRMVAASLSSSSINRIAAAEDPSMAGFAGTGSRASGTGALLHQLAHDKDRKSVVEGKGGSVRGNVGVG